MDLLSRVGEGGRGPTLAAAGLAVLGLLLVLLAPEPGGGPAASGVEGPVAVPAAVRETPSGVSGAAGPGRVGLEAFQTRLAGLEHAVEADPENRARILELARLLHDAHRLEEALPLYRRAVELDPEEPSAVYDLSAALLFVGRRREAQEALEAHLGRAPGDPTTLYNLGVVLAAAGDGAAARARWIQARDAGPEAPLLARIEERLAASGPRGPP